MHAAYDAINKGETGPQMCGNHYVGYRQQSYGCSQQGYSHIENGRAELKIEDLITLCRYYNLSADYLIGLSSKPLSCPEG